MRRAAWVLDTLWNQPVPPPPPNAGDLPTIKDKKLSVRARLDQGALLIDAFNLNGASFPGRGQTVTVNFSQFGGGTAVTATDNSGIWTATYTITAGSINTTNANVSVMATDVATNSTTTAGTNNATVDDITLAVASHHGRLAKFQEAA